MRYETHKTKHNGCPACHEARRSMSDPITRAGAEHHAWYAALPWAQRGEDIAAQAVTALLLDLHTNQI